MTIEEGKNLLLETNNLLIIPCSLKIADTILDSRDNIEQLTGLKLAKSWPEPDLLDFLPWYREELNNNPNLLGYGIWLIILKDDKKVIGDIGFKGEPDRNGAIEIGYSIITEYRRRGYAFEAAEELLKWGREQKKVRRVLAECMDDNVPSIRILKKLGLEQVSIKNNLLQWELNLK